MENQFDKYFFRLREFRKRLGLKQDEMAAELSRLTGEKITQGMLSNYEAGRFEPSLSILMAYFNLDLSPNFLFLRKGPMLLSESEHLDAPSLETKRYGNYTEYVIRVKT